jgi:hypothetical protein
MLMTVYKGCRGEKETDVEVAIPQETNVRAKAWVRGCNVDEAESNALVSIWSGNLINNLWMMMQQLISSRPPMALH